MDQDLPAQASSSAPLWSETASPGHEIDHPSTSKVRRWSALPGPVELAPQLPEVSREWLPDPDGFHSQIHSFNALWRPRTIHSAKSKRRWSALMVSCGARSKASVMNEESALLPPTTFPGHVPLPPCPAGNGLGRLNSVQATFPLSMPHTPQGGCPQIGTAEPETSGTRPSSIHLRPPHPMSRFSPAASHGSVPEDRLDPCPHLLSTSPLGPRLPRSSLKGKLMGTKSFKSTLSYIVKVLKHSASSKHQKSRVPCSRARTARPGASLERLYMNENVNLSRFSPGRTPGAHDICCGSQRTLLGWNAPLEGECVRLPVVDFLCTTSGARIMGAQNRRWIELDASAGCVTGAEAGPGARTRKKPRGAPLWRGGKPGHGRRPELARVARKGWGGCAGEEWARVGRPVGRCVAGSSAAARRPLRPWASLGLWRGRLLQRSCRVLGPALTGSSASRDSALACPRSSFWPSVPLLLALDSRPSPGSALPRMPVLAHPRLPSFSFRRRRASSASSARSSAARVHCASAPTPPPLPPIPSVLAAPARSKPPPFAQGSHVPVALCDGLAQSNDSSDTFPSLRRSRQYSVDLGKLQARVSAVCLGGKSESHRARGSDSAPLDAQDLQSSARSFVKTARLQPTPGTPLASTPHTLDWRPAAAQGSHKTLAPLPAHPVAHSELHDHELELQPGRFAELSDQTSNSSSHAHCSKSLHSPVWQGSEQRPSLAVLRHPPFSPVASSPPCQHQATSLPPLPVAPHACLTPQESNPSCHSGVPLSPCPDPTRLSCPPLPCSTSRPSPPSTRASSPVAGHLHSSLGRSSDDGRPSESLRGAPLPAHLRSLPRLDSYTLPRPNPRFAMQHSSSSDSSFPLDSPDDRGEETEDLESGLTDDLSEESDVNPDSAVAPRVNSSIAVCDEQIHSISHTPWASFEPRMPPTTSGVSSSISSLTPQSLSDSMVQPTPSSLSHLSAQNATSGSFDSQTPAGRARILLLSPPAVTAPPNSLNPSSRRPSSISRRTQSVVHFSPANGVCTPVRHGHSDHHHRAANSQALECPHDMKVWAEHVSSEGEITLIKPACAAPLALSAERHALLPPSQSPCDGFCPRRQSMFEMRLATTNPPPYPHVMQGGVSSVVLPREEEGQERLPHYSCVIHLEGWMPRKMEFRAPGIQAKDRGWRRQYVILHGTMMRVYRSDPHTHPVAATDDPYTYHHIIRPSSSISATNSTLTPARPMGSTAPPLHFHQDRYDSAPFTSFKEVAFAKASQLPTQHNSVQRVYTLQNAESGLAADYLKRKYVVRVRAEGEQFLLQAKDDRGVIDLIEALQAATNVSLDLDIRPLPKFITLPRRRRRRPTVPQASPRVRQVGAEVVEGMIAEARGSSTRRPRRGQAASFRRQSTTPLNAPEGPGDRLGDMLAEEQDAYMGLPT